MACMLALAAGCGDDGGDDDDGVAACAEHNAKAAKCGATSLCKNATQASCLKKYPGAVCDNGKWGDDFMKFISCQAGSAGR